MTTDQATPLIGTRPDKKLEFLFGAVRAGDKRTVSAILAAPAYLSGIKEAQHQTLRDQAARQWAPVAYAQYEAIEKVLDYIRNAGNGLTARIAKAQQLAETPKAKARAKIGALEGVK